MIAPKVLISAITFSFILIFISGSVYASENILVLKLTLHKDDTVDFISINLDEGKESIELTTSKKEYQINLINNNGTILYKRYFQPSFTAIPDIFPGQNVTVGEIELDKVTLVLKVPDIEDSEKLQILHSDRIIFETTVDLCNSNNICESNRGENYLSCPLDCKSGSQDNFCDGILDGVCDADCLSQGRSEKDIDCTCGNDVCDLRENEKTCPNDCGKKQEFNILWVILGSLVVVGVSTGIFFLKRKSHKKRKEKK